MKVRFTVKADAWDEIDLPDDLTDSGVQQELRQWVLDVANFWWEIKNAEKNKAPFGAMRGED